ncbi:glycerophosphoryl diester phosphodiesterase [Anaerolineae bacterium]|nr:glycerophosphoryl diester phosphodiesterase [Anaerolineae bacterium]
MNDLSLLHARYVDNVLVFGHRGARAYAPMNTIPSFLLAVEQEADGIELDVWLSKDGHLVVIHNDTVDETTDGSGVVTEKTLAELKALDAGGWFGVPFLGTRIPTLDEVFQAMPEDFLINVEIKKADNTSPETDGVEAAVAACIRRHQAQERVIVSSFSLSALEHFNHAMPELPGGLAYLYALPEQLDAAAEAALEMAFMHPLHEIVTDHLMNRHMDLGALTNVWTVNDPARMRDLIELGVNGIITDKPDVARSVVNRLEA